jgi:hypothetical protein
LVLIAVETENGPDWQKRRAHGPDTVSAAAVHGPETGWLKDAIRFAFVMSRGKPLTTAQLVDRCYPEYLVLLGDESWYRQNVRRAALKLAVPCGRSHKRGRPILWAPRDPIRETEDARLIACAMLRQRGRATAK